MPPRILIFVALSGVGPRAAAGAACELAPPGSARPVALDGPSTDQGVRRTADRLAEHLDLRPIARPLATLAHLGELLRERPDATIVIDAERPAQLLALLEAADLARARLDAGRPPAGTSTLAAERAAGAPGLAVLRAAAAAGDLLRAPELTSTGLLAGPHATTAEEELARTALAFAGLAVVDGFLPGEDPARAAEALLAAGGAAALARDPAPVVTATAAGAEIRVPLPALPDDLRAVRSGRELTLHAAGFARRLRTSRSLGPLVPGAVTADDGGAIVAEFGVPSVGADQPSVAGEDAA